MAELKYVKSSISVQDYFDDILRLHLARNDEGVQTYFIVCGKSTDFIKFFQEREIVKVDGNPEYFDVEKDVDQTIFNNKQKQNGQKPCPVLKDSISKSWLRFNDDEDKMIMIIDSVLWQEFSSSHFYRIDKKTQEVITERSPIPTMPRSITTKRICVAGDARSEHFIGIWEIL